MNSTRRGQPQSQRPNNSRAISGGTSTGYPRNQIRRKIYEKVAPMLSTGSACGHCGSGEWQFTWTATHFHASGHVRIPTASACMWHFIRGGRANADETLKIPEKPPGCPNSTVACCGGARPKTPPRNTRGSPEFHALVGYREGDRNLLGQLGHVLIHRTGGKWEGKVAKGGGVWR